MVDWKTDKIKNCVKIATGSKNTEDREDNAKYPFFVRSAKVERISTYTYDEEAVLTAGDGVGTGKIFHYINGKFDVHQRVYVMTDFKKVSGKYFYYYFSKNFYDEVSKYTAKSSVDSVRRNMIADMDILIPPEDEQTRIVQILADVDEVIDSLERAIVKKCNIRLGVMQQLMTGKRRLPGFTGEWTRATVNDVASVKDGTHGTFSRVKNGVLLLSAKNIFDNRIVIDENESKISESDYKAIVSNGFPKKGDILLSCVGTLGRCTIFDLDEPVAFQRSVAFIRVTSGQIMPNYLKYLFQCKMVQDQLESAANASAQKGIYLGAIKKVSIDFPKDIREQQEVCRIIDDLNTEIDMLESKLHKYRNIKQGMMQELLSGRIRLV
ncbi:MAG: restriction endonuclease subunit S [Lachnospiraceae bacterium]|nr:restriction endonuclease subunit S [Lachnospiraceae bacterium]